MNVSLASHVGDLLDGSWLYLTVWSARRLPTFWANAGIDQQLMSTGKRIKYTSDAAVSIFACHLPRESCRSLGC